MTDFCVFQVKYFCNYHHQGGYVFAGVCLSVCEQHISNSNGQILIFSENVHPRTRKYLLDFGKDPTHHLEPEFKKNIFFLFQAACHYFHVMVEVCTL